MVVGKVRAGDQISLPVEIQQAVGIEPGDLVSIDVTAGGSVVIRRLPTLTLSEALDRYQIEGPIDDAADREAWQDVASRDVLGADEHG